MKSDGWGEREYFVYWLFDDEGRSLYVGMTKHPELRWKQHQRTKSMMCLLATSRRMAGPFTKPVAQQLEREQQEDLQPKFDVRQRRKRLMSSLIGGAS